MVNLGVSLLSIAVFFGSAELLSRNKYTPKKIDYKWVWEYDSEKGYRLKKNYTGEETFLNHAYSIITNSQGYRDSEIPVQKPPKTIRILVLGDSVSFGTGVDGNHVYPEYLEGALNSRSKEYHFDVINTAASGNSAFHEYYDLKRGLKFSPDLIIQQFALNDVTEPYQVSKRLGGRGTDYHEVVDAPYYDHLLQQYSAFYLWLKDLAKGAAYRDLTKKELREKALSREIYAVKNLIKRPNHPLIKEAWDEYFIWAKKINSIAKESSLPTILLAAPSAFQLSMDSSQAYPQEQLRRFSEQNNIIYIDLLAFLRNEIKDKIIQKYELPKNSSYSEIIAFVKTHNRNDFDEFWREYYLDYNHFTPLGHRMAGEILYTRVINALELSKD